MASLGLGNRTITQGEMLVIDKWFDEYGFSLEMVLKGCENSAKVANPTVNYIDGVLKSWSKKDIKTIDDIEEKDKPKERKQYRDTKFSSDRSQAIKTRFHNFEQRSDKYTSDELDNIVENISKKKREEYKQGLKGDA